MVNTLCVLSSVDTLALHPIPGHSCSPCATPCIHAHPVPLPVHSHSPCVPPCAFTLTLCPSLCIHTQPVYPPLHSRSPCAPPCAFTLTLCPTLCIHTHPASLPVHSRSLSAPVHSLSCSYTLALPCHVPSLCLHTGLVHPPCACKCLSFTGVGIPLFPSRLGRMGVCILASVMPSIL